MPREEKPIVPPTRKPVAEYQTPSPAVVFFTELVNRTSDAYTQNAPVARGTLYSSIVGANQQVISAYPDLYFLKERKLAQNDQLVFWDWATVPDAEDTYNAEVDYVSNAVPYPAFTRVYTIKRDTYDSSPALAIGSTLTGLIGVNIVNGGQDYTFANGTINGTDVAIEFVIQDGVIVSGVITNEGTGILSTSTIIVTGDGSGAVVTPIVQGTNCYLTKQKKQELPQDDPLRNEFVRVIRVYETLPGPFIPSTRIDEDGKVVTINTRRNIAANIVSAETLIGGSWCKTTKKGDDNFVGEESVECRDVPGNPLVSTKIDEDGKVITITKTLKDTTLITSSETVNGNWIRTYKEEVSDLVANEIIESRPIPGNAIPYTKVDDDGKVVTGTRTLRKSSTITSVESLIGGVWTHTFKEKVSDLVSWEVTESRPIPGNPVPSSRLDDDGVAVSIVTTLKDTTAITTQETLIGGVWTKTTKKEVSDLVAQEIVESRAIPGNPIPYTKLDDDGTEIDFVRTLKGQSTINTGEIISGGVWIETTSDQVSDLVSWEIVRSEEVPGVPVVTTKIDEDGKTVTLTKTLKDTTTITSQEQVAGGNWIKTYKQGNTLLVAHEVIESRPVPGNPIVKTVIDAEGDIMTETRTMVEASTISTTNVISLGVWTKTFEEPISDLVAWKVVQVRNTQNTMDSYEVEIPDLIPVEFRPDLPITTHEDTIIGTASLPTLAPGDLMRRQAQLDAYTYRLTVRGRAGITLPKAITNKETTSQFGGGDINVTMTLDLFNNLSLDEGLTVLVPSEIKKLDDQVNGLAVKTSKILNAASWPVLDGTHVDPIHGISIDIQKQTVDAGTTGGLIGGSYVEVKSHDKWKSIQFTSTLNVDSLPEDVQWFGSEYYSFPPELQPGAVIEWADATCGCVEKFAAVLQANMNQYRGEVKARYTEQFYNGPPPDDVTITQFFPEAHVFGFAFASVCGCGSDSTARVTAIAPQFRLPLCLHDDITFTVGIAFSWSFPATSPAALPHGTYIMLKPHVERQRFGIFRRVLTEILVP